MKGKIFMANLRGFFLLLFFVCFSSIAQATSNNRFVWNGDLTKEALIKFDQEIKNNPRINELEFRDSKGASSSAGIILKELNALLQERKIKIFVRGQCASACATAFFNGKERSLLPTNNRIPTYIMIHAMRHNITGEINYGYTDSDLKNIVQKSHGTISLRLLEKIYETKNSMGGIYIFREPFLTIYGRYSVLYCIGDEFLLPRTCHPIKDVTLQNFDISIGE